MGESACFGSDCVLLGASADGEIPSKLISDPKLLRCFILAPTPPTLSQLQLRLRQHWAEVQGLIGGHSKLVIPADVLEAMDDVVQCLPFKLTPAQVTRHQHPCPHLSPFSLTHIPHSSSL